MKKLKMNIRPKWLLLSLFCGLAVPICYAQDTIVEPIHVVTLSQAHKGDLEIDTYLLDSYGRLPEGRRTFYLTAREILFGSVSVKPTDSRIIEAAEQGGIPLISGPTLGDVSDSGITVWFRPIHTGLFTVQVTADGEVESKEFTVNVTEPGAATRVRLTGLASSTHHTYQIVFGTDSILGNGSISTAPKANTADTVRIAFGSCFHKIGVHNPNLMRQIVKRRNHAMLLIGDLAVDDREARFNEHYSDYLLRDVSKAWRDFSANIPVYTSWDDHDYLNNDKSGLQKGQIDDNERNTLRKLWQENWVNPETTVEDRGIYFNTVIGDVEIIILDTRSCRNWSIQDDRGAYLGDAQMEWLFNTLQASTAEFIIMSSGTMWSDYMSNAKDSWGVWDIPGREEIFNFIEDNVTGSVLLISGDRHGARGFTIERPSGFELYEFEAATLGGVTGPGAFAPDRSSQLFGYGGSKRFGEFTFVMSKPDPEVTFHLINETGDEAEEHTFSRSQLTPGYTGMEDNLFDEKILKNNAVKIFQSGFDKHVKIVFPNKKNYETDINVYDVRERKLLRKTTKDSNILLNKGALSTGLYIIEIKHKVSYATKVFIK